MGFNNVYLGQGAAGGATTGSGGSNTFVGQDAGSMAAGTSQNTFVGQGSARNSSLGSRNVFFGQNTGVDNQGSDNTFIGKDAGLANTTGIKNTFVGHNAGMANTMGDNNVFFGKDAGLVNTIGRANTFVGLFAGKSNTTGERNTFVGYEAGKDNTTGSGNVFIGYNAGSGSTTDDNKFALGNSTTPNWLTGDISSSGNLYVNGNQVQVTSSRTLKKDIVIFEDHEKSLQDIINTPLYNYRYKNKMDFPEKTRMGIISEELPDHLQLKQPKTQTPSQPDWPSVYGTFWSSIKALYSHISELEDTLKEYTSQFEPHQLTNFSNLTLEAQKEFERLSEDVSSQIEDLILPSGQVQQTFDHIKRDRGQLFQEIFEEQAEIKELQVQLQRLQERLSVLEGSKAAVKAQEKLQ